MYVKYVMKDPEDYRGHIELIYKNEAQISIAYANVSSKEHGMVPLVQQEIEQIEQRTRRKWLSLKDKFIQSIDRISDSVRLSYLNTGTQTVDIEYIHVADQIENWRKSKRSIDDLPDEVIVWSEVSCQSLEWALNDIENKVLFFKEVLRLIRRYRLLGKAKLTKAEDKDLPVIYNDIVSKLEALRNPATI